MTEKQGKEEEPIKFLEEAPRLLRATAFGLVNPKAQICQQWFEDPTHQRTLSNYLKKLADNIEKVIPAPIPESTVCKYCNGARQYMDHEGMPRICEECDNQ